MQHPPRVPVRTPVRAPLPCARLRSYLIQALVAAHDEGAPHALELERLAHELAQAARCDARDDAAGSCWVDQRAQDVEDLQFRGWGGVRVGRGKRGLGGGKGGCGLGGGNGGVGAALGRAVTQRPGQPSIRSKSQLRACGPRSRYRSKAQLAPDAGQRSQGRVKRRRKQKAG